ncbi:MAG: hypothetical protein ABW278_03060 [Steroidobacteraceae bacterium]
MVVQQPVPTTTAEAVAEGEKARGQDNGQLIAPSADPTGAVPAPPSDAAVSVAMTYAGIPADQRAQRFRPSMRSTQEILDQASRAGVPLDFSQRLDYAHDRIYTWGQRAVEATDRRFARKDRELKPVPAAPFRLGTSLQTIEHSDGMKFDLDADLDISLRLPNIEDRLRIFVTSDELDGGTREAGESSQLRAGLRYQLLKYLDFDVGVRVDVPPVAFTSVKWTREFGLGSWDFYPLAKVFAETKESVGYAAAGTFDHWSGRNLLRSSTYAKWRMDRDRTEWSQTVILARAHELIIPDRYGSYPRADDIGAGWGMRLLASGEDAHEVSRYEAGIFYRRGTGHRWLFWHVEPLVRWDRDYNWSADAGIRVGIDALFWDLARPAR